MQKAFRGLPGVRYKQATSRETRTMTVLVSADSRKRPAGKSNLDVLDPTLDIDPSHSRPGRGEHE